MDYPNLITPPIKRVSKQILADAVSSGRRATKQLADGKLFLQLIDTLKSGASLTHNNMDLFASTAGQFHVEKQGVQILVTENFAEALAEFNKWGATPC